MSMRQPSPMHRRAFLTTNAIALAGLGLGARMLSAAKVRRHGASTSAYALLDDPLASDQLRHLATEALGAAKAAGAHYADTRCAYVQTLMVNLDEIGVPLIDIDMGCSYGVRAMVNGALAFDYGTVASNDAIAITARNAVTQAKGFAALANSRATGGVEGQGEFAPAPMMQGEWQSAVQIDPFAVPILEQADLLGAIGAAVVGRLERAGAGAAFHWQRETRVCATTEGTLVTQTFTRASPSIQVYGSWLGSTWPGDVSLLFPDLGPCLSGYECVVGAQLQERVKAYADTVMYYAGLYTRPLDIGRYPVVFDGQSTATLLNNTIGPALQCDRVLGLEPEASGGSFLGPYTDLLNTAVFSSQVSVSASRPTTDITGVQWDDEGVAPSPTPEPMITAGRVVDYLTDRQTAPVLRAWYDTQRIPLRSHGFAAACRADQPVLVGSGHLDMTPGSQPASVDDLVRGLKHGLLLIQNRYVSTDQQLASGFLYPDLMLEVKNGVVTNRVKHAGLQFKTTTLWKGVDAIGDATTLGHLDATLTKGQPWQAMLSTSRAPAMRCKSVDVIQVKGND